LEGRLFDTEPDAAEPRTDVPPEALPLAARMRPRSLDEVVGQEHLLAPGSALRTAIERGEPHSMILYGPPGSGKTTLARIIAAASHGAFEEASAVAAGRAEVRAVIDRATERRRVGEPTMFFLDEIHRFNKAQQDALLPAVEEGLVTLIGATTENPYFEVISALLSRCQIYELRELGADELEVLLRRALGDPQRGIAVPPDIDPAALRLIAERSGGDARVALTALERAVETALAQGGGVGVPEAEDALQRKAILYDREGDRHYDYISAWIKATRGSDPDASLYYLAAMLEGGEDPRFIARRMVILASEDIGNADPMALVVATAAGAAVDRVGLPECALNLAQAAAYLALAPKSNASIRGIAAASRHIREHGAKLPPPYLRDAHYPGARKLGRGEGYVYPHGEPGGVADQPLLPEELEGERFYEPTERGREAELRERLDEVRRQRGEPARDSSAED
jgi:putative ATPase